MNYKDDDAALGVPRSASQEDMVASKGENP